MENGNSYPKNLLFRIFSLAILAEMLLYLFFKSIEFYELISGSESSLWDFEKALNIYLPIAGVVAGIVWHLAHSIADRYGHKVEIFTEYFIRGWLAFVVSSYGWAKVLKTQFQTPESVKDVPMIEQHPFWLTWYYFGFSREFGLIIASIQIIGGAMLLFKRSRLIGAVILLPVMLNIVLINYYYSINPLAFLVSIIITAGLLYLLILDYEKLVNAFFRGFGKPELNIRSLLLSAGKLLTIVLGFLSIWMYTSNNNPTPDEIRGVWQIDSITTPDLELTEPYKRDSVLTRMYFEYHSVGQMIMEFNHHRNRQYTQYELDLPGSAMRIKLKGEWTDFRILENESDQLLLSGEIDSVETQIMMSRVRKIDR